MTVFWCASLKIAIFEAGPNSGFAAQLDSHRLPHARFPHISFSVRRSRALRQLYPRSHNGFSVNR
jgi:hypothetical protein